MRISGPQPPSPSTPKETCIEQIYGVMCSTLHFENKGRWPHQPGIVYLGCRGGSWPGVGGAVKGQGEKADGDEKSGLCQLPNKEAELSRNGYFESTHRKCHVGGVFAEDE